MANETKIYVGEAGAKELYRHIKGLIPTVDDGDTLLEDSHNPVSSRVVYNALRNFGGFVEVAGDPAHGYQPIIVPPAEPSSKLIYLVDVPNQPGPDTFKEWIWSQPDGEEGEWKCIGDISKATVDSWKSWSAEHGSTADGDNAVYIGPNNTIDRDDTYVLGDSNTVETTDQTDYSDTDVVVIGTENTATNAANAYQLGRNNAITGNNLAYKQQYPNQLSMNLGDSNTINGEGINIGKCNTSTGFGITLGQNNTAQAGSLVLGSNNAGGAGSVVVGKDITLNTAGSILFGDNIRLVSGDTGGWSGGVTAFGMDIQVSNGSLAIGRDRILANNGSVVIGVANITGTGGSIAIGHDGCSATDGSLSIGSSISSGSGSISIGKYGSSTGGGIHIGMYNSGLSSGIAIGNSNTANGMSSAIGYHNTVSGTSFIYGTGNNATATSVAIGKGNDARNDSVFIGNNNVRESSIADNSSDGIGVAIGCMNTVKTGAYNVVTGKSNTVSGESITIGTSNSADGWSIVLGYNNTTSNSAGAHSTIIGYNNTSTSSLETLLKSYTEHIDAPYTPSQEEIDAINDCISTMNSVMTKYMSSTDCATCTTYYNQYRDYVLGIGAEPTYTTEISTLLGSLQTAGAKYNVSQEDKYYYRNVLPTLTGDANTQALLDLMSKYTNVDKYYSLVGQGYNALYYSELGQEFSNLRSDFYWYGINYDGPTQTSIITDDTDYATYWNAYSYYYSYCYYINQNRINGQNGYDQQVSDSISCNSVVMGSNNTANHYNSILIGAYNSSLAPSSETQVSDDDGFTLAIGYKNTVGRNYDFAFGYRSVANGGENVAIQHSSAIGYRNIAMIDSTVTGIANIALVESTFTPSNTLSAHNFLFNSSGTVEATESDSGGVQRNVFIDSYHAITAQNVSENFIFGGAGKQNGISPVTITSGYGASGNIMFGSPHKSPTNNGIFTIITSTSACDNVFIHPKEVNISADTIQDTAIMGRSTVNMAVSSSILDNIISASTLSGTCHTLHGNTFISNSSLETERTGSTDGSIRYNLVMNESSVYANKNVPSFWNGLSQPIAYNIVSGSIASDTHACIAIGDGMLASQPTNTVVNSKFSFVFGDNYVDKTQITTAFGTENNVSSADHTIVYGSRNNVIGQGNTTGSHGIISTSLVFGRENIVHSNGTNNNLSYGTVIGNKNYLYATQADSVQIFGSENIVSKDVVPVSKTVEQITAIQQQFESDQSISYPSIVKFTNSGTIIKYNSSMPASRQTTSVTAGDVFVFSPYENYNHVVFALQGEKQSVNARLLPTDDYSGYNINNVLIAGNKNTVGDRIVGYTILGRDNKLTNQLNTSTTYFAISNGFIQGSNNTVSNGSHIVCMGNSNESTGHDSVAIGMHLKSNQWQTVIGKYNAAKDGTRRTLEEYDSTKTYTGYSCYVSHNHVPYVLTASSASGTWDATKWREQWPDGDKVLFAIGHGYSTKEDSANWQNESYMTRSNAVEVMGDGRLVALKGLSSYKSAYFDGGIQLYRGDLVLGNGNITVSNGNITSNNIPAAPPTDGTSDGTYVLQCVVANGTETYAWVRIGTSTV